MAAIETGNYLEVAAAAGGIHYATLRLWQLRGQRTLETGSRRKSDRPFLEFYEATTRASLQAEARLVQFWANAASIDWRAAESLLARRFPQRWARRSDVTLVWDLAAVDLVADIVDRNVTSMDDRQRIRSELTQLAQRASDGNS